MLITKENVHKTNLLQQTKWSWRISIKPVDVLVGAPAPIVLALSDYFPVAEHMPVERQGGASQ